MKEFGDHYKHTLMMALRLNIPQASSLTRFKQVATWLIWKFLKLQSVKVKSWPISSKWTLFYKNIRPFGFIPVDSRTVGIVFGQALKLSNRLTIIPNRLG